MVSAACHCPAPLPVFFTTIVSVTIEPLYMPPASSALIEEIWKKGSAVADQATGAVKDNSNAAHKPRNDLHITTASPRRDDVTLRLAQRAVNPGASFTELQHRRHYGGVNAASMDFLEERAESRRKQR